MRYHHYFVFSTLLFVISWPFMLKEGNSAYAEEIQFNTDIMDVDDKDNIDVRQFPLRGFILPGRYLMKIRVIFWIFRNRR